MSEHDEPTRSPSRCWTRRPAATPARRSRDPPDQPRLRDCRERALARRRQRTTASELADLIAAREIAVATRGGQLAGASASTRSPRRERVRDAGRGPGSPRRRRRPGPRRLRRTHSRERGLRAIQLELLVPRGWRHPSKEFLKAWYGRRGYRIIRTHGSTTRTRTWRRCSPPRATSRSTRSRCSGTADRVVEPSGPESGRQDLNLRPPGPQPGALPDCATPRYVRSERATGIEPALEAWKASVQPQHFARTGRGR